MIVSIYLYVYIYMYMYTHTHIHIQKYLGFCVLLLMYTYMYTIIFTLLGIDFSSIYLTNLFFIRATFFKIETCRIEDSAI